MVLVLQGAQAAALVECTNRAGWRPSDEQIRNIIGGFYSDSLCNANLSGVDLSEAALAGIDLSGAMLAGADLSGANLYQANLAGADLSHADLTAANLSFTNLSQANLTYATVREASLFLAILNGADLTSADFSEASLIIARMDNAQLVETNLRNSHANGVSFSNAQLVLTDLTNARFTGVDLTDALYEPASAPATGYLVGITGLTSLRFNPGHQSGLVALSKSFQAAGLRQQEREIAYALYHGLTRHALNGNRESPQEGLLERFLGDPAVVFEGAFQLVFFEWTTAWGLHPGRALLIMFGLMLMMTLVYAVPIAYRAPNETNRHGIFLVWPRDRIVTHDKGISAAEDIRVEHLHTNWISAWPWALYFSILSTFHIGWRELNVGTWLNRMQLTEFGLRGRGWPRLLSGIQSLISVYLLAMWALTYFGRPFQ